MFSWFRSTPPPASHVERVWITEAARLGALLRTAHDRAAQGRAAPLLVIAFFDDTRDAVVAAFAAAGLPLVAGTGPAPDPTTPRVLVADQLRGLTGPLPAGLDVWVAESHPLPSANNQLVDSLQQRTNATPTFHVALDEPLMQRFGGAKIASLAEGMGMTPDEPIEHALVTRSLANIRAKVAAKVKRPRPARSMAAWVADNLDP